MDYNEGDQEDRAARKPNPAVGDLDVVDGEDRCADFVEHRKQEVPRRVDVGRHADEETPGLSSTPSKSQSPLPSR